MRVDFKRVDLDRLNPSMYSSYDILRRPELPTFVFS